MGLIGISGKKSSGKDTVADIINFFTTYERSVDAEKVEEYLDSKAQWYIPRKWKVKKFADKLKDIVCLLIGCTREQLEDREFKEKELGEEWWYYTNTLFNSEEKELVPYLEANDFIHNSTNWYIIKLTPRLLMQLIGTECGRNIVHPNIWLNALMSEYKPSVSYQGVLLNLDKSSEQMEKIGKPVEAEYPNWIITDLRFPNELHAIEGKGGLTIRVNRENPLIKAAGGGDPEAEEYVRNKMKAFENEHESETALDTYIGWDYVIENDGSKQDLIEKVREILIKEKLI